MWASAPTANNAVVGADIIRPPPGLLYGFVEPERRHDGLLHGVGPLGGELVVADTAHKAAGLGPAHGLKGPGGDGGVVGKGGRPLRQGCPMASARRTRMVAACSRVSWPLGLNCPLPTPLMTPMPAIFWTFTSVVSVNSARSAISLPVTVSYSSTARAQNWARVAVSV